ncbi:cytochrome c biogenesis protein CcsA [Kribbella sp. NPDC026611]|uniref:cytochrome c biogenesis protein CcsA n=1 Tax=Kribbella sp. NPDC026611 TaxID=3154911 RepID=UPI0033FB788A
MWTDLSGGFLLAATAVYALAALMFGVGLALSSAAAPRRASRTAVAPGGQLVRVGEARRDSDQSAGADSVLRARGEVIARIGVNLTVLAAVLHGADLLTRGLLVGRAPLSNLFEFTVAASFVATISYLVIGRRTGQLRELGLLALLPITSAMFLAVSTLYKAPQQDLPPSLQSYWIGIHVTAAAIGVGSVTIGAVGCAAQLKAQRAGRPDLLPRAEKITSAAFAFAFPVWTFAVTTGAIWANYAWGRYWGWDPKEIWAFVSWVMLAAYLHSRRTAGVKKRTLAVVGLIAYGTLLFNFIGVNLWFSGLHSYAGL